MQVLISEVDHDAVRHHLMCLSTSAQAHFASPQKHIYEVCMCMHACMFCVLFSAHRRTYTAGGGKTHTFNEFIEYAFEQLLVSSVVVESVTMHYLAFDSHFKPVKTNDTEILLTDIETAQHAWQTVRKSQHTERTNNNDHSSRAPLVIVFDITLQSGKYDLKYIARART
jgi:hypothetical protein